MDFSETIEVKVVDKEEHFSIDSYFFAYFHDLSAVLNQIRDAIRTYRTLPTSSSSGHVVDTTLLRGFQNHHGMDRAQSLPTTETATKSATSSGFSFTSLLKPFQDTHIMARTSSSPTAEDFTHVSRRGGIYFISDTTLPAQTESPLPSPGLQQGFTTSDTSTPQQADHTYPPPTPPTEIYGSLPTESTSTSSWSVGVPGWLKNSPRKIINTTLSSAGILETRQPSGISEVLSAPDSQFTTTSDLEYNLLETPNKLVDAETIEKFHTSFALDEREELLGCKSCCFMSHFSVNLAFKTSPVTSSVFYLFMEDYMSPPITFASDPADL